MAAKRTSSARTSKQSSSRKPARASKSSKAATTRKSKRVWERPAPRRARHGTLTPAKKAKAKARAKRAGRPYPNLVDNMRAARR